MPLNRLNIFISSVQHELEPQRRALKNFLLGDAFLRKFIDDVFLFEDVPAKDRKADGVYLDEVEKCDVYIGIFGYEYGSRDSDGISPTEREFDQAADQNKTRLIYIWGFDENKRDPDMKKLIKKASSQLVRRKVDEIHSLTSEVYASLVDYLSDAGQLKVAPFDASICAKSNIGDISEDRVTWFLKTAESERKYALKTNTGIKSLLKHLNLTEDTRLTNAALLLFGNNPQKCSPTAEIKCIHCHGIEYRRPFDQQIYRGDIFNQADLAVDFVMARISRIVGTRKDSHRATAIYEIPRDAVAESIINALTHRDYYSKASVEVRLFADRLEVWNPGRLPENISIESLYDDHPSIPNNPLIAEPLYLTRYIEKAGSGTQMIIDECSSAGLPKPDFIQKEGIFIIKLWRNWLNEEKLKALGLNKRQVNLVEYLGKNAVINNSTYCIEFNVSKPTATRDLQGMLDKGILSKTGSTGKGTFYELKTKGLTKGSESN